MLTHEKEKLLHELKKAQARCPDLRLGQLLVNVIGMPAKDPFYITDRELMEKLEKYG